MQRYNITELSSKTLEELQEIAREIGFSPDAFPEKRELIYEILDQQAVTVAERRVSSASLVALASLLLPKSLPMKCPKSTPATSSAPADDAPRSLGGRSRGRAAKA